MIQSSVSNTPPPTAAPQYPRLVTTGGLTDKQEVVLLQLGREEVVCLRQRDTGWRVGERDTYHPTVYGVNYVPFVGSITLSNA